MSYCLNPLCQRPQNPDDSKFCQFCGSRLFLVERYRAIRRIGQGGFGRTFLAVDEADPAKSLCVIKQFFPTGSPQTFRKAKELFRQEADRLAQLGIHPQIPKLLARIEQDDGQYLIQEFIDGHNLEDELADEGPLDEPKIRDLLNDLLPVLRFIHSYNVMHRDIKPENIIRPVASDRLVLVDFGASKYATGTALAKTGTVIGSAGYVAPEQAIGKAEFASDLYSLGVTCIHLLTAIHPFDLYSVSEDNWIWRDYLSTPVSESLGRILDKMLQRATRQRYRTATEVLQDLSITPQAIRAAQQISVGPRSRPLPPPLPPRSQPRSVPLQRSDTWTCIRTLVGFEGSVTAIAVHPDGHTLASASTDHVIRLWDLTTGEPIQTLARSLWYRTGHRDRITGLLFSPDGDTLISSSEDNTIILWNLDNRRSSTTLMSPSWFVSAIALSGNGDVLASGSGDGHIHLWDVHTGELLATMEKHRDRISALVLSPDHQLLISGSFDKTIRLWSLQSQLVDTWSGHGDRVTALAISPDGRTVVSGSADRNIKMWDLDGEWQTLTLAAHVNQVNCLAFSPDGAQFASGSEDRSIIVWDAESGDRLSTLQHTWGVTALSFTPEGQLLISGSADETIKVWQRT